MTVSASLRPVLELGLDLLDGAITGMNRLPTWGAEGSPRPAGHAFLSVTEGAAWLKPHAQHPPSSTAGTSTVRSVAT